MLGQIRRNGNRENKSHQEEKIKKNRFKPSISSVGKDSDLQIIV